MDLKERLETISKMSALDKKRLLMAALYLRRIPQGPCQHKQRVVARNVTIQLPLREGCLRSEDDGTFSQDVNFVAFCGNPCCEKVFAMEKA